MTPRLIFDIEANDLLANATKIHCIAAIDIDTGAKYVWGPSEIQRAIDILSRASLLVAHGGIRYDYPLLSKLTNFKPSGPCLDSVVLARLIKSDTKERDLANPYSKLPGKLIGSHSLEAWGLRLGVHKMTFEGPWAEWSQAMQDYCVGDTETLLALWRHLEPDKYSPRAIELEHRIARVTFQMEQSGWPFDVKAAGLLHAKLTEEKHILESALKAEFGSWFESAGQITPKADNKRYGYVAGATCTKIKEVEFNPASRQHIYKCLMKLGWKPKEYTDSGQPKVDEAVLDQIAKDFPQADKLSRLLMLNKRIGQLATGDNAWLRLVSDDGFLHPAYNTNGCVTGRSSHLTPNIAQVPKVGKPYGEECRSLFIVPTGWTMVGSDQSGLEQRCLAHYTSAYDAGEYAKTSLEAEDIHWLHCVAIGIAEGPEEGEFRKILRDCTKTWFYAYIYGASDRKLTSILRDYCEQLRKAGYSYRGVSDGEQSRKRFGQRIPALETLRATIVKKAESQGAIKAIDGRAIPCSSPFKALNYACQSAGAIICKEWVASTYETLIENGFKYGWDGDFAFLGWIHDELQIAVRQTGDNVDRIKRIVGECGRRAGTPYGFRVSLDVESAEGKNWAETH
jgi:DNA polymerase-1